MSWRRVGKSLQQVAAHTLLIGFTLMLVLKLNHVVACSWWVIFFPLWLFHAVVARGRFSLPAPSVPHGRHWAPCHAVVAVPPLVAFELLLCIYLESTYVNGLAAVNLKLVFLPLLAFEVIVLVDNLRMCKVLLPGDDENMSDEAIWERLPFTRLVKVITNDNLLLLALLGCNLNGFLYYATVFTLLKLGGDVGALGWWDLLINYGIAECFAFLVCTKWSNPVIHRNVRTREECSSSTAIRYLDWDSGLMIFSNDHSTGRICSLQDIGGHIMKVPIVGFQILLCMWLEGAPPSARNVPLPVIFSPILLVQGTGVLFAISRLVEKVVLLLRSEAGRGLHFIYSARVRDCFGFLHHGSRLLGWWSIDETSREEQVQQNHDGVSGYNTFCGYPPEIVKKMPKEDLTEEVWRLQAALGEQTQITKFSQQEYERLQHEKNSVQSLLRGRDQCCSSSMQASHIMQPVQRNLRNVQSVEFV